MRRSIARIELTPRVIALGAKVIQLSQVVSASFAVVHPLRPLGVVLLAGAVALLGSELSAGFTALIARPTGSTALWLGFAALGVAIFCFIYARRLLIIATSDGSKVILPGTNIRFLTTVVDHIREAMSADRVSTLHLTIDLTAETIEPKTPNDVPPAGIHLRPRGASAPEARVSAAQRNGKPSLPHERSPDTERDKPLNGTGPHRAPRHDLPARAPGAASSQPAPPPLTHTAGNLALAPLAAPASAALARGETIREFDRLLDLVTVANIQHKEALLKLLRVVEDHLKGGKTGREDALAHWKSFADYANQYLMRVDGLIAQTDRTGLLLGKAPA